LEAEYFADYMLPEGAHNRVTDWTIILLHRDKPQVEDIRMGISSPPQEEGEISVTERFLYGLNLVHTKYDDTVKRGAIAKAICLFSRHHFLGLNPPQ